MVSVGATLSIAESANAFGAAPRLDFRPPVRFWNFWGIYCLSAILFVAVAGSPMVRLFGDEPRDLNTWVLFFPYPWLPVILVTVAISGHILVTRKLLRQ